MGVMNENKKRLNAANPEMLCERKSKSAEKVICSSCKGYYSKKYYFQHAKKCDAPESEKKKAVRPEDYFKKETSPTFTDPVWEDVISNMQADEIKDTVIKDEEIKQIGYTIIKSKKPNKLKDSIIKSRTAMRHLGRMSATSGYSLKDLLKVKNMSAVEEAIATISEGKPGLRVALRDITKFACKVLIPHFICLNKRETSATIREFQEVFSSSIVYAKNFATAEFPLRRDGCRKTENQLLCRTNRSMTD